MSKSESRILAETLVAVSALDEALVWRNNTGQAWQGRRVEGRTGDTVRIEPGMVILRGARPIRFGLEGSGDIIGVIRSRPVAIETKDARGRQRATQEAFERHWTLCGGIYILARDATEAVDMLERNLLIG